MSNQIPPADELASIRAQLDALRAREAELRNLMLTDPSARTGNAWLVEIREVKKTRTDLKEMREMHPDVVDAYTFLVTEQHVVLRGVDHETGEIMDARRFKAKTARNAGNSTA